MIIASDLNDIWMGIRMSYTSSFAADRLSLHLSSVCRSGNGARGNSEGFEKSLSFSVFVAYDFSLSGHITRVPLLHFYPKSNARLHTPEDYRTNSLKSYCPRLFIYSDSVPWILFFANIFKPFHCFFFAGGEGLLWTVIGSGGAAVGARGRHRLDRQESNLVPVQRGLQ